MRAIPPAGCGVERHTCSRKYSVTLPTSSLAEPLLLVAVDWNDLSSSSASSVSLSSAAGSSFGPRGGRASIGRTASECSPVMKSSGSMSSGARCGVRLVPWPSRGRAEIVMKVTITPTKTPAGPTMRLRTWRGWTPPSMFVTNASCVHWAPFHAGEAPLEAKYHQLLACLCLGWYGYHPRTPTGVK